MSKRFSVTIRDDLYETLMAESQKLDLSPNKYTALLLAEKLQEYMDCSKTAPDPPSSSHHSGRRRNYTLDLSDATLLREKASALGLCDTAYLRLLIRTKNFIRIDYTTDDLFEYLARHQKVIDSILSIVDFIRKDGKELVFAPDIKRIIQLSEEIKAAMIAQVNLTFGNRAKVYKEMIRKIEVSVYGN